jgi:hypothetical protein
MAGLKTLKGRGFIPVGTAPSDGPEATPSGPEMVPADGYGQFAVTARGVGGFRRWYVWHLGTMLIAAGRFRLKRNAVRLAKLLDRLDFSGVTKTARGGVKDADGVMEGVGRASSGPAMGIGRQSKPW